MNVLIPVLNILPNDAKIDKNAFFSVGHPSGGKLKNLLTDETVGKATASVVVLFSRIKRILIFLKFLLNKRNAIKKKNKTKEECFLASLTSKI